MCLAVLCGSHMRPVYLIAVVCCFRIFSQKLRTVCFSQLLEVQQHIISILLERLPLCWHLIAVCEIGSFSLWVNGWLILCVEVVQTMNDCYQHCLSTCQRLRDSLNMTQICPIDVASLSAAKLLYNYAIDAVCRLGMLLECWLFATNHVLVVWNQYLLHVHYLFSYAVKAFNDNEVANTTDGWLSMLWPLSP